LAGALGRFNLRVTMNRVVIGVVILTVGLMLASVSQAKPKKSSSAVEGPPGVTYKGGDGHDCKHAVIIHGAKGETVEAEAESKWLEFQYPGYKKVKQQVTGGISLGSGGGSVDSLMEQVFITTADGQEKTICFGFASEPAKH